MYIFLAALILAISLNGCVTMADGEGKPDYVLIEIGALAGMTILVNEMHVADDVTVRAYDRLLILQNTLACTENCPPMTYPIMEGLLHDALPIEYRALGSAGLRLIDSRVRLYIHDGMEPSDIMDLSRKISLSVVTGMIQALEPHVLRIQGDT